MADSREYRDLKEYRNKELKWFLFANILLMLVCSDILSFGEKGNISILDVSSILGATAISSAIYIYTFILDSVLPSKAKVFLVFLWKRQPSCTIFTDMEHKFEDDRFKLEDAKKKYSNIYEKIRTEPSSFDQTPLWYEIYNKHRNNTIVFGSNKDYLLLRDMHSQTIILILVYLLLCWFSGFLASSWKFVLYLSVMTVFLNIGARVQGKRMVYNVFSIDLNESALEDNRKKEAKENDQ